LIFLAKNQDVSLPSEIIKVLSSIISQLGSENTLANSPFFNLKLILLG